MFIIKGICAAIQTGQLSLKVIRKVGWTGCQEAVFHVVVCVIPGAGTHCPGDWSGLINLDTVAIGIQAELIGGNGTGVRPPVFEIYQAVGIVIAIGG